MQHLKAGDFVTFQHLGKYYYFLILTKSAFFGCQWIYAFHGTTLVPSLLSQLPDRREAGFIALVDFIEPRRANAILKLKKGCDVDSYLAFDYMKARIRQPDGRFLWYIYNRNFSILKKQTDLAPQQNSYPLASGLNVHEACDLIDMKWTNDQVLIGTGGGQYSFIKDHKK